MNLIFENMPENQGIYNIEKQEAGWDIFNIVIQHLATGKKVNLPSIQYALRKGESTKGNFFKNEPEWVDYEQGYIVERKEVSEIIKNLENEKVQLVLGKPASGKSLILKNIGFKLANENKKIYIVELKKHQIEDVKLYFEAIPEINDDNPIFILDDAHLYHLECEKLIIDFKSGGKGKLIIGLRPTEDILPTHPKKTSEFQFISKTVIQPENVAEKMIRTFLKKQHKFSKDRIKTVSRNLHKYKNDLWQLSWALNAYKPEKDSVDEEEIYENIMLSITKIEIKDKKTINAEDIFHQLSVFYRYEIPVERCFLEEQMDIEGNLINQLIGLQEIMETEEAGKHKMLSMHHSSLAELYFGTYQSYPDLGRRIKKKVLKEKDENEENILFYSFHRYITTTDPRNVIEVVNGLERGNEFTLFKKLIAEVKIQELIKKGITEKEEDIIKVGFCVGDIARASEEVGLRLVESVSAKIEKENRIEEIGLCVSFIASASREVGLRLVESVSVKIEKEDNIHKIGFCVGDIARASEEVGLRLVESVSAKIEKEEDMLLMGACVAYITRASEEVGLRLVESVSARIEKENLLEKIGLCVSFIASASEKVGLRLSESVSKKIEKEKNTNKIGECLRIIALGREEVAKQIINHLNPKLKKELEKFRIFP